MDVKVLYRTIEAIKEPLTLKCIDVLPIIIITYSSAQLHNAP